MDGHGPGYGPSVDPRCLVVIGSSWGGAEALRRVLGSMPVESGACLVIVNHRRHGPSPLARSLSRDTPWRVVDAEDKDPLVPGTAYLAPGGYHLLVEPGRLALSTEGPVRHCRPSVDVLFESAADAYGADLTGVVLTGNNDDGAAGLARIAARGGTAVVQDPATAERATMPAAALAATPGAVILGLDDIAPFLHQGCGPAARIVA
ncbi:MAG: two-component system, chemotaxis family, protein-glutamate methylesterase/glutaminase [Actinomycetota bacterium]|nr:two-component system, chemotaxis family, protein-glutamate methylesterase/glutaminase [Actinomycetota bacterium]